MEIIANVNAAIPRITLMMFDVVNKFFMFLSSVFGNVLFDDCMVRNFRRRLKDMERPRHKKGMGQGCHMP